MGNDFNPVAVDADAGGPRSHDPDDTPEAGELGVADAYADPVWGDTAAAACGPVADAPGEQATESAPGISSTKIGGSSDDAMSISIDAASPSGDEPAAPWQTSLAVPQVGDLLVTELMVDPSGPQPQSQWVELFNLADSPRLLSGLTIEDGYPHTHVIGATPPVIAAAHSYVLMVRDRAFAPRSGVPPEAIVYEYGAGLASDEGIQFGSDFLDSVSLWNGDTALVNVPYGSWGLVALGQSIELATLDYAASGSWINWCTARHRWALGADYGTPGAPNDCF
jgi:hypothetical protein